MNKLITIEDIADIRQIASNVDPTAIDPYVIEAQRVELQNALGFRFFNVVLAGLAAGTPDVRFTDLLNGKDYTIPVEGSTPIPVSYAGLKPVIAYYAYARAIPKLGKRITRYGGARKRTEFSDPLEPEELGDMSNEARSMAKVYVEELKRFLEYHQETYPEYFSVNEPTPQKLTINITAGPKGRPSYGY